MLKNACRVCSKYASATTSMNIFENNHSWLLQDIQTLTGLWLKDYNCLPQLICDGCCTELRDVIKFRDRCIDTQQELLATLSEQELNAIPEYYKTAVARAKESESVPEDAESQDANFPDDSVDTTAESLTDETDYDIIVAEETINLSPDEILTSNACDNDECNSDYAAVVLDNELNDAFVVEGKLPGKTLKNKRSPRGIFICDQCGNYINGRMAFELHCRRHRGEKQYQCEICEDRFCTTSELKRHMRKHTGERPFACHYCERRFTDYSTRVKHERTHTNERPYACTDCGKAFTTAYILKNHMLIHTGERAFKCDLCNKSFLRNTHLATHLRSAVHKRYVEKALKAEAIEHIQTELSSS